MNNLKKTYVVFLCLLLSACGGEKYLEGEYRSSQGEDASFFGGMTQESLVFGVDGKVTISIGGRQVGIVKYERKGDEVTLFVGEDETEVLTIEEDGTLFGGGNEYIKSELYWALGEWNVDVAATERGNEEQEENRTVSFFLQGISRFAEHNQLIVAEGEITKHDLELSDYDEVFSYGLVESPFSMTLSNVTDNPDDSIIYTRESEHLVETMTSADDGVAIKIYYIK